MLLVFADGRRWHCELYDVINKEKSQVQVHRMKLILKMSKRYAGRVWSDLEVEVTYFTHVTHTLCHSVNCCHPASPINVIFGFIMHEQCQLHELDCLCLKPVKETLKAFIVIAAWIFGLSICILWMSAHPQRLTNII